MTVRCFTLLTLLTFWSAPLQAGSLTIETVAGAGGTDNNGDEGTGPGINVGEPFGVEIGPDGALYITEVHHHRVRRLNLATGRIGTVAGSGQPGYSGDGGSATKARLNEPYEVRFDPQGHMFFVEMQNHVVRRVDAQTGTITTVAGTGVAGFSGDGGPATQATFRQPHSIALDGRGNLYVADIGNHRIRRIQLSTGIVESIAGNDQRKLPVEGQIAKDRPLLGPRARCSSTAVRCGSHCAKGTACGVWIWRKAGCTMSLGPVSVAIKVTGVRRSRRCWMARRVSRSGRTGACMWPIRKTTPFARSNLVAV